jgi:hypothetical protein
VAPEVWARFIVATFKRFRLEEATRVTSSREQFPMNFAAKLNVVAAYIAFAFVCAIVFGMV